MNKFSHLEKNNLSRETDWCDDILLNTLPKRAFTNPITSMFILSIQDMIKIPMKSVDLIRNWWRV